MLGEALSAVGALAALAAVYYAARAGRDFSQASAKDTLRELAELVQSLAQIHMHGGYSGLAQRRIRVLLVLTDCSLPKTRQLAGSTLPVNDPKFLAMAAKSLSEIEAAARTLVASPAPPQWLRWMAG